MMMMLEMIVISQLNFVLCGTDWMKNTSSPLLSVCVCVPKYLIPYKQYTQRQYQTAYFILNMRLLCGVSSKFTSQSEKK
jgi:hypothetical protein